jgi:hypothetical protein
MPRRKGVYIDPDLHHRYKVACCEEGVTLAVQTEELIRDWLDRSRFDRQPVTDISQGAGVGEVPP